MSEPPIRCPDAAKKRTSRRPPRFRVTDLGVVKGNHNMVHAINNVGQMVGCALGGKGGIEAFVRDGRTRRLGSLGGVFSAAHGINNGGQIVGGSLTADDQEFHAFLFTSGTMYDLNELLVNGGTWELTQAVGINDRGQIIGIGLFNGEDHVFLLQPEQGTRRRSPPRPRVV